MRLTCNELLQEEASVHHDTHISRCMIITNGDERYHAAHDGILAAIEQTIACGPKTPDMKGSASTQQVSEAICKAILA